MKYYCLFIGLIFLFSCDREPKKLAVVKVAGSMRDFIEKGYDGNAIKIDTISPHRRLYGLGPLEGYTGEILVIDGRPYSSRLTSKGRNRIRLDFGLKAPYFVYAHVRDWHLMSLPNTQLDSTNLEKEIEKQAGILGLDLEKPFPFMLRGQFKRIDYRINYHPKKPKKRIPENTFSQPDVDVIVLGFYSRHHQLVFTPAGSNVVMAFMTTTASQIGQIDHLVFDGKRVQLLLPE